MQAVSGAGKAASSKSKAFKLEPAAAVKPSPGASKGKQFKSPRSAKENTVWIYEDGAEGTPCQVHTFNYVFFFGIMKKSESELLFVLLTGSIG